jgi:hypothetical protein
MFSAVVVMVVIFAIVMNIFDSSASPQRHF